METKKIILLALVMAFGLAFVFHTSAQTPTRSGDAPNLWLKMDDSAKFGYILGFSNASENYQMVLRYERNGCTEETQGRLTSFLEQNPMPHAPMSRWKSLVDEFYQDRRNERINLVFAMQIASLLIAEHSQAEIDGQIQGMRELANKP
jgi:hypothetical protein